MSHTVWLIFRDRWHRMTFADLEIILSEICRLKRHFIIYQIKIEIQIRHFLEIFDLVWPLVTSRRSLCERLWQEWHFGIYLLNYRNTLNLTPNNPQIFNETPLSQIQVTGCSRNYKETRISRFNERPWTDCNERSAFLWSLFFLLPMVLFERPLFISRKSSLSYHGKKFWNLTSSDMSRETSPGVSRLLTHFVFSVYDCLRSGSLE